MGNQGLNTDTLMRERGTGRERGERREEGGGQVE